MSSGALAVDMESHIAGRFAQEHGLPFAAIRAVADPHSRALPEAALVGMKPNGAADVIAVARALARSPRQMPALLRTALDTRAAMNVLFSSRRLLGLSFGFDDLSELVLDVA